MRHHNKNKEQRTKIERSSVKIETRACKNKSRRASVIRDRDRKRVRTKDEGFKRLYIDLGSRDPTVLNCLCIGLTIYKGAGRRRDQRVIEVGPIPAHNWTQFVEVAQIPYKGSIIGPKAKDRNLDTQHHKHFSNCLL